MSLIIDKTYDLLDSLDNSDIIKNLTLYKHKLENNSKILDLIKDYQKELDINKKILIKKELYKNRDYKEYLLNYNKLSYIILKINNKYKEYTKTRGNNNGDK